MLINIIVTCATQLTDPFYVKVSMVNVFKLIIFGLFAA
jgi:hypothetical protein